MKQDKMHNLQCFGRPGKEARNLLYAHVLVFCSFLFDKFP